MRERGAVLLLLLVLFCLFLIALALPLADGRSQERGSCIVYYVTDRGDIGTRYLPCR